MSRLIGNIAASFSAIAYGSLHHRDLENNKTAGLKYKGNSHQKTILSLNAKDDIHWLSL